MKLTQRTPLLGQALSCTAAALLTLAGTSGSLTAATLFGTEFGPPTELLDINQTNGLATPIGPSGQDQIGDLTSDTRPGSFRLWGNRIATNELYSFNPNTGVATLATPMTTASQAPIVSLAFDVVSGKLYGNTSVGFGATFEELYEIDPATGNTTFIGRILFDNVFALAFDQAGQLFGISDSSNELISISTATGNGSLVGGTVGSAFDIASHPTDGTMFLATSGTVGTNSLYTVDTGSGATNLVGNFGTTRNVAGLAFGPSERVPDGGTSALLMALGLGSLGLVRRWLKA